MLDESILKRYHGGFIILPSSMSIDFVTLLIFAPQLYNENGVKLYPDSEKADRKLGRIFSV